MIKQYNETAGDVDFADTFGSGRKSKNFVGLSRGSQDRSSHKSRLGISGRRAKKTLTPELKKFNTVRTKDINLSGLRNSSVSKKPSRQKRTRRSERKSTTTPFQLEEEENTIDRNRSSSIFSRKAAVNKY